jgi:hypothetical protein
MDYTSEQYWVTAEHRALSALRDIHHLYITHEPVSWPPL